MFAQQMDLPARIRNLSARPFKHRLTGAVLALLTGVAMVTTAQADAIGPLTPEQRAVQAYELRVNAAQRNLADPLPSHPDNGD